MPPPHCTLAAPFTPAKQAAARADFAKNGHNEQRLLFSPDKWLTADSNALVVDVGSYTGVDLDGFARRVATLGANVTVHTYEPVPSTRRLLLERLAALARVPRAPAIHVHPFGLSDRDASMCVAGQGDAASLRATGANPRRGWCPPPERTRVADAWTALRRLGRTVDLMQVNCEGCELAVMRRLVSQPDVARVVRGFEIQFHANAVSVRDYCALERALERLGYGLVYRYPFVWELWRAPY